MDEREKWERMHRTAPIDTPSAWFDTYGRHINQLGKAEIIAWAAARAALAKARGES